MNKKIYIGPAGWFYKDWEGIVYPAQREKGFDYLNYLSSYFNTIEINSSFYRPPTEKTALRWIQQVQNNREFLFSYKLWQRFTHQRETFPGVHDELLVKSSMDILQSHQRLGALLIQFPWSFKNDQQNLNWLEKILGKFKDYSPVVEFRHQSWETQNLNQFLLDHQAAFVNIDQPVIGNSLALTAHFSSGVSYLRLHGRNYQNWFAKDANAASRYDYLYQLSELENIREKIADIIENSSKIFIMFNNHFRGQAVANAIQFIYLLTEKKVDAPDNLVKHYPQLMSITNPVQNRYGQTDLF